MKQQLWILLIFSGFWSPSLFMRYNILYSNPLTWSEARTYCYTNNIDLADIRSSSSMNSYDSLMTSSKINNTVWIGLHNAIDSWYWVIDNSALGPWTSWMTNEPNNAEVSELCVAMTTSGWLDAQCNSTFPFVCYDAKLSGNAMYVLVSQANTWSAARSYCKTTHTDLASVKDATVYAIVLGLISTDTWIGMTRYGWNWTISTNTYTIPWASGQPDNNNTNENCGAYYNRTVYDEPCTSPKMYICYFLSKDRQILQVKIQSAQDVNNPSVRAEMLALILQKVQQKMAGMGIYDYYKIRWKTQPDGKVFTKLT